MKRYSIKISGWILVAYGLALGCNNAPERPKAKTLPYYSEATFSPHWLDGASDELEDFHRISAFELINQEGDTITEQSLRGKVYVADFFFTSCPGICPKMTTNMAMIQQEFLDEDKVLLLSHSVTPEYDSVAVLKDYAINKGVQSHKWYLLTGDRDQIYSLGRNDYFVEEDLGLERDNDDFLHTENFVLIDQNGHIRGIYNGLNKSSLQFLIDDIRLLLSSEA